MAHFEGSGLKRAKYVQPDPDKLAKEGMDVIRFALQVARYYGTEARLEALFVQRYRG